MKRLLLVVPRVWCSLAVQLVYLNFKQTEKAALAYSQAF